jgi:hypothetical protein
MSLRPIQLTVRSDPVGHCVVCSFPVDDRRDYLVPTYPLTAEGQDDAGNSRSRDFEVLRFGVEKRTSTAAPHIVGLAEEKTHVIQAWLPHYSVHSAASPEKGAWRVFGNFLIHDGPDDTDDAAHAYATIGCIEICKGPQGFVVFNDFLISLSGSTKATRDEKLAEMGASRTISITYRKADRPPLAVRRGP